MSSLRSVELNLIDEIFRGDEKGYILDFSNRTFAEFFARELNVDIDASEYMLDGISKGKRLRCFLKVVDDRSAVRAIRALWDYREALKQSGGFDPRPHSAHEITSLISKLDGRTTSAPINVVPAPKIDSIDFARFRDRLLAIRDLQPQQRGYDFEQFLIEIFNVFRLKAREPFRLVGEQIDGSFELADEIYLMEAKWLNRKVGAAELHTFQGKIEQKASWARGLFISFGGFTDEGLHAFGRGKRVVGMDGRDLYESLGRGIGVNQLLAWKVRRAAETGEVFAPIDAFV